MKKMTKIGVVGCGYWGPNLVRNFRAVSGCKMELICDADENRLSHLKSLYSELQTSKDFEKTAKDPNLDAMAIATPVRFHHQMAKACLMAGKHTFIEKPMASSAAECDELIELAKTSDVTAIKKKLKEIVPEYTPQ